MKNSLFALLMLLPGGLLVAQNRSHRVPETVQQSFHRDYPDAANPRWSQSNGQWHADFTDRSADDRGEMVAHYDRDGRHIDSHIPYNREDVPASVMERAKKHYHGGHNYRFTRIERPGDNDAFFQVRVNLNGRERTTYINESGRDREYHDRH
jgi:hypothetical protein